jgi:cell division protein FtsB
LRRIRLVYRRSSNTLKIVVIAALVLGTLSLLMLRGAILRMEQKAEELRQQAAVLEQENKKLEESISQLGTVQSVTDLAEQLLGLVDPDTVIFSPEG